MARHPKTGTGILADRTAARSMKLYDQLLSSYCRLSVNMSVCLSMTLHTVAKVNDTSSSKNVRTSK